MNLQSYAVRTDQGPYLHLNEDGYDLDLVENYFSIIDGFGGSGVGDKCVDEIKLNMKNFYNKIAEDPNATLPFFFSPKFLIEGNALINALLYTHKKTYEDNIKKPLSKRGGACGIFAIKDESILTIASIGNPLALLIRRGELRRIFIPDDFSFLTREDFERRYQSIPLGAIGLFNDLYYQVKEVRIEKGDIFVFMTDGVYNNLRLHEILHCIDKEYLGDYREVINSLFSLSNKRGNLDNQTTMILKF